MKTEEKKREEKTKTKTEKKDKIIHQSIITNSLGHSPFNENKGPQR